VTARPARGAPQRADLLDQPAGLLELPGVGPGRAARLAAFGVRTPRDLLTLVPARVEVGESPVALAEARNRRGVVLNAQGEVRTWRFSRFGRRSMLRVTLADGSGELDVLFFNQPWLRERFAKGERIAVRGRIVEARGGPALTALQLASDARPLPAPGSLTPVYPAPPGVSPELLRSLVQLAVERYSAGLHDRLEPEGLSALDLPPLAAAVRELARPSGPQAFEQARRRLVFESLLGLQARLTRRRSEAAAGHAPAIVLDERQRDELAQRLPFELTAAQRGAIEEIRADLARNAPMRRLLQGDVGSGKTAVGAWACFAAAARGAQAAFLAPTELLAEQHLAALAPLLDAAGVRSVLLTGSLSGAERRAALAACASGAAQVAFGTHALLGEDVCFERLALAVIDEQHRFGVAQRSRLLDKGRDVHALLMTATPIPRSLALTLYGDLDVSVLREKPAGRGELKTRWLRGPQRARLIAWLGERLEREDQVYWVVPRIDAEDGGAEGAQQRFERLSKGSLARYGLELVHGRLAPVVRAERLQRFRDGAARLLVATTLIEVGLDVPRASVMVIEEAQRLGLAQLHQLRGRVGRGPREAWCLLLGSASAAERCELLERCSDGFALAEEDLRRRGMGDLAGLRQAGDNAEGLGDLERDLDLLFAARDAVRADAQLCAHYLERARPAFDA
jgi:ATP-dependent DNA helicase RecG